MARPERQPVEVLLGDGFGEEADDDGDDARYQPEDDAKVEVVDAVDIGVPPVWWPCVQGAAWWLGKAKLEPKP